LIVSTVIQQHAEDAAVLHAVRTSLTVAPHVRLRHLRRFDDRLAAHLDGLVVAGDTGWAHCMRSLESPTPGRVFAAAVPLIEAGRMGHLGEIYALVEAVPQIQRGLVAALAWVEREKLQGVVAALLTSSSVVRRTIGIAVCALHRVDPGSGRESALEDSSVALRARALRSVGELGRQNLTSACLESLRAEDSAEIRFWAAWSAVLLGNRQVALDVLKAIASEPSPFRQRALQLGLQAMKEDAAEEFLRRLGESRDTLRLVIQGSGISGDPARVPWLIQCMTEPKAARLAGEAFCLMMGLDLAYLDLDRKPPTEIEAGPNDDPNDPNVEMDPDDGLPWPDQKLIQAWWNANSHRFQPGVRYFMGEPLNRQNCVRVLKEGFQRQRIAAAIYLSLLNPGTQLFEWRAPAWRQKRLLATMT